MLRVLLVVVGFGLALYALIDCIRTEDEKVKGLPKLVWVVLIVLVSYLGPLAWLLVGRERAWPSPQPDRPRPMAPDDDPDFLRNLDRDLKKRNTDGDADV